MASNIAFLSLLLTATATFNTTISPSTTTTTTTTTASPSPTSPFSLFPPPPPLSQPQDSNHHQLVRFNSIIDAIIGAGDFGNWANLLAQVDPSILPISATLFIPDDDAFLAGIRPPPAVPLNFLDPLLFPYHIVPRRLSFSDLHLFPTGARIPTLLPGYTLVITNNSVSNFTVNGAPLTRPDLFQNGVVSVHGIGAVLDYTLFGRDIISPPENPPPSPAFHSGEVVRGGDEMKPPVIWVSNSAVQSSTRFQVVSLVGLFALFLVLIFESSIARFEEM